MHLQHLLLYLCQASIPYDCSSKISWSLPSDAYVSHPQCHPKTKNYAYELSRMEANCPPQVSTFAPVNEYCLHYSHGNTAYHYLNWASHLSWPYLWCNCYPLVSRSAKYSQTTSATSSVLVTMCSDLRWSSLQFLGGCTGSGSWSYSHLRLLSCSR